MSGERPDGPPDAPEPREPTRDEILDNMPEAVATRRAREGRVQAAARQAAQAQAPAEKGRIRRRAVVGATLAFLMGARIFERAVRGATNR